MKILLLSHSRNNKYGGASRVYHTLEEGLSAKGHSVRTFHYEDFSPLSFPPAQRVIDRLLMPQFIAQRIRVQDPTTYDVIMAPSGMGYSLFRWLGRQSKRRPVTVNHLHGLALFDHQANLVEWLAGREQLSLVSRMLTGPITALWDARGSQYADLTVVQNDRDYDFLMRSAVPPRQLVQIAPGIDPDVLAAGAAAPSPQSRPPASLLWFGSWICRKGIHALPMAFDLILKQAPEATLTIGGVHMPEREILSHFSVYAAARVRVLPRISVSEQAAEFGRHAIFLFPSLSEGYGLALVEAMALGLAAVTTQTGVGGDLLVHGDTAMIVPEASAIHLARGVLALIQDKALRHAVARKGQALALTLSTTKMIARYEQVFIEALAERGSVSRRIDNTGTGRQLRSAPVEEPTKKAMIGASDTAA